MINMKKHITLTNLTLTGIFVMVLFSTVQAQDNYVYKPGSQALYDAIAHMDSVYFTAARKV
jgi:hypothetical protein